MSDNKIRSLAKQKTTEARRRRAAEALRANLSRRKNQQRVRALDDKELEDDDKEPEDTSAKPEDTSAKNDKT